MIKISNYIVEVHECLAPKGYIIEISKKMKLDGHITVEKQYVFYDSNLGIKRKDIDKFIDENIIGARLRDVLKKSYLVQFMK